MARSHTRPSQKRSPCPRAACESFDIEHTRGAEIQMATTADVLSNFIDGERVDSQGESEPILNPATGEEIARAPISTAEDVNRAVSAARRAFEGWSQTTPAQRSEALLA